MLENESKNKKFGVAKVLEFMGIHSFVLIIHKISL